MSSVGLLRDIVSVATLSRTRAFLDQRGGRSLALLIGVGYALISMTAGQMLVFGATGASSVSTFYLRYGSPWWSFPMFVVLAPNAVVTFPFFATIAMVLVSAGIGMGMAVAVMLAVRLVRLRRQSLGAPTALGSAVGLTPAMIALVTLGACCSTTAAATAGIGVVAQASGTTVENLLVNSWYLGIFQVGVVWVSLIAQERLVTVYRALSDPAEPPGSDLGRTPTVRASPARRALRMILRVALLVGGLTWALVVVADWTVQSPGSASAGLWFSWILGHLVPASWAMAVALFPGEIADGLHRIGSRIVGRLLRAVLVLGGGGLILWWPAPLVSAGVHGLLNELLGAVGAPTWLGGSSAAGVAGLALGFRWGVEMLLVGGFSVVSGIRPEIGFASLGVAPAARSSAGPPPSSRGVSRPLSSSPEEG